MVIAGSATMPGAAYLCGQAAMRSGAGLVTIAVPTPLLAVMGAKVILQTLAPLPASRDGSLSFAAKATILELVSGCDAAVLGPGLGAGRETVRLARELAAEIGVPLVLDADGLNALGPLESGAGRPLAARRAPAVLTPHPGEMSRLLGVPVSEIQRDREGSALRLARATRCVVNLKGSGSVVTDGQRVHTNKTGNPGMATGGTGDVLAGITAAFLARGLSAFDAAVLAAHVHGRAGDLAAARLGEDALVATDLLDYLPGALCERLEPAR